MQVVGEVSVGINGKEGEGVITWSVISLMPKLSSVFWVQGK